MNELLDADVVRMATTQQAWLAEATVERLERRPAPPCGSCGAESRTIIAVAVCALILGAAGGGFLPELLRTRDVRETTMMATVRDQPGTLRVRVFDAVGHQVSEQRLDAAGGVREFHSSSETVVPGRVDVARDAQGYERTATVPDMVRVTFDGTMIGGVNASRTLEFDFGYARSPVGVASFEPARVEMRGKRASVSDGFGLVVDLPGMRYADVPLSDSDVFATIFSGVLADLPPFQLPGFSAAAMRFEPWDRDSGSSFGGRVE